MTLTPTSIPTADSATKTKKGRRTVATALSVIFPGVGQIALGKIGMGVTFISMFCLLGVLYWLVRLPASYFGLQVLIIAMPALCLASSWHALRSQAVQASQASRWWLLLVLPLALVTSFAHSNWLLLAAGFRPFVVPSSGMEKTILEGDRIMVDQKAYRNESPKRGEVVIFGKEGMSFVKRAVAVTGDTIEGKDGVIFLNRRKAEEPYATHFGNAPDQLNTFGPVVIPSGQAFVMGDNRDVSRDSRMPDFGLVPNASMTGRGLYVVRSKSGKVGRDLR